MKKIPSLFARTSDGVLTSTHNPLADWVLRGEGIATRKWDGTACRIADGVLWARYDCKRGKEPPEGFVPCQDPDPITGHWPGWVPATRPEDKWIREAAGEITTERYPQEWTYEACGPKIGGNKEKLDSHILIPHGHSVLPGVPLTFTALQDYFREHDIEGVVWWRDLMYQNCDKVKITGAALGIKRGGSK